MNTASLQTFLSIVETGSLVRASQKMNVSQSTITARLKTLEQEIGQTLLTRNKHGTTLTPAGTKLLRYAKVMTGLWRQAMYEAGLPAGTNALCSFGCHRDLWYGPGKKLFDNIVSGHPEMALSVYQGSQQELEEWLTSGLVDIILTFEPVSRGRQTIHPLNPEKLVLYSNRTDSPMKFDPLYVFVDHGEEFRREHDEAYYDASTARITFDCPVYALEYILEHGGSAYLPASLATPHLENEALHEVADAPIFLRKKHLIANDEAEQNWPWFGQLINQIQ